VPPRGRDEVMAALVRAAGDLLSERGPSAVSVRDIAGAAGVNQALVFRHFGDKAGLVRAVLDELGGAMRDDPAAASLEADAIAGLVQRHRRYLDVLTRVILDPESTEVDFPYPVMRQLVADASLDDVAAGRIVDAVAAVLGWVVFQPYVAAATGRPAAAPEEVADRVAGLVGAITAPLRAAGGSREV